MLPSTSGTPQNCRCHLQVPPRGQTGRVLWISAQPHAAQTARCPVELSELQATTASCSHLRHRCCTGLDSGHQTLLVKLCATLRFWLKLCRYTEAEQRRSSNNRNHPLASSLIRGTWILSDGCGFVCHYWISINLQKLSLQTLLPIGKSYASILGNARGGTPVRSVFPGQGRTIATQRDFAKSDMARPHPQVLIHWDGSDVQTCTFWKSSFNWFQHIGKTFIPNHALEWLITLWVICRTFISSCLQALSNLKEETRPGWCSSVDCVPACKPKGHRFDSQSGHIPELWPRFPSWTYERGNHTLMFISLSFSPSSPTL